MGESKKNLSPKCPQGYICPLEEKVRIYISLIISENKKVKIDIIYLYRMTTLKIEQLICFISQIPWASQILK